jgi:hypothetical protein
MKRIEIPKRIPCANGGDSCDDCILKGYCEEIDPESLQGKTVLILDEGEKVYSKEDIKDINEMCKLEIKATEKLARADERKKVVDEVIKFIAEEQKGLEDSGYYTQARALHHLSQVLDEKYEKELEG